LTKVSTIFVTSDESYELGREISPLGIQYYAIKPVDVNDMRDLIASLTKIKVSD
jgi:response regulator of citrate/malate metabolism